MSSDLLGAFGAPSAQPPLSSNAQDSSPRVDPDDEEEEEDFGDFEDVHNESDDGVVQYQGRGLHGEAPTTNKPQVEEHRGWAQPGNSMSHPEHPDLREEWGEWGEFASQDVMFDAEQYTQEPSVGISKNLVKKPIISPQSEAFDTDTDNSWNPVDVQYAPITPVQAATREIAGAITTPATDNKSIPSSTTTEKGLGPPPTNIPPPSVLLFAINNIFQDLSTKMRDIVAQDRASSDPYEALDESRITAVQKQMSMIRASARIIAGRKLRWKRDTMLSQGMKIGPAGQGGIKLNNIDKNETRREDQEVSEVVYIWKKQLGPLRSTIGKVNIHLTGEGLAIPDISETIPVRQGNTTEGAIKGKKCCFLCGLNRDERVAKVDIWVEDSFGEWWAEYWGHMDCVEFWNRVKNELPQR